MPVTALPIAELILSVALHFVTWRTVEESLSPPSHSPVT